ncbi:MAG: hypothetical protein EA379_02835, partial [Phycisphaerales bacterium]
MPQSSVAQNDITFTFEEALEVGQFVDGSWWVVGDGKDLTGMTPDAIDTVGEERNGAQVNPTDTNDQPWDSRSHGFNASLRVTLPYTMQAGDSIIKTISVGHYSG